MFFSFLSLTAATQSFLLFFKCYHRGITSFADEEGFGQLWVWLQPAVSNMGALPDLFSQKPPHTLQNLAI